MLPSPSLRDRLLTVTSDVAQSFIVEIGINGGLREDNQLIIWGDDALNEMAWEFSQSTLERWGWLLGREWVARTNFWRRQRGAAPLPDCKFPCCFLPWNNLGFNLGFMSWFLDHSYSFFEPHFQ